MKVVQGPYKTAILVGKLLDFDPELIQQIIDELPRVMTEAAKKRDQEQFCGTTSR